LKSSIDTCKNRKLEACLEEYLTEAEQIGSLHLETLDNRALCNAKDKLETCLETEAPNCDIMVTSPAQATLIAARQICPDEAHFHMSKGYVRCISFVLSLAMSFVQYSRS